MPAIPEKSKILIRLWEYEKFADKAIYKGHFVDANSVHWLDPTHNVFGLGLTTQHTYPGWGRKRRPERKVLLMNCNKKRNPEFSKGKKDMNEINWIWSLFQCLEECEELYYQWVKNLEIVISFCISIKLPTFSMLDGRSKTWFEF